MYILICNCFTPQSRRENTDNIMQGRNEFKFLRISIDYILQQFSTGNLIYIGLPAVSVDLREQFCKIYYIREFPTLVHILLLLALSGQNHSASYTAVQNGHQSKQVSVGNICGPLIITYLWACGHPITKPWVLICIWTSPLREDFPQDFGVFVWKFVPTQPKSICEVRHSCCL